MEARKKAEASPTAAGQAGQLYLSRHATGDHFRGEIRWRGHFYLPSCGERSLEASSAEDGMPHMALARLSAGGQAPSPSPTSPEAS